MKSRPCIVGRADNGMVRDALAPFVQAASHHCTVVLGTALIGEGGWAESIRAPFFARRGRS